MRRHLAAKDVQEAAAEGAVAELLEQGYLDDQRYATRFAEDRRTVDGWGGERIERRLRQVGVADEHVTAALTQPGHDDLSAAVHILQRRFSALDDDRERERALGHLVRKGYELEVAYDAIRAFGRDAA